MKRQRFYLLGVGLWGIGEIECDTYTILRGEYKLYNGSDEDGDNLIAVLPIYNVAIIIPFEDEVTPGRALP